MVPCGVVWCVWVVVDSIVDHGHGRDEIVDGDQRESWGIQGQLPRSLALVKRLAFALFSTAMHGTGANREKPRFRIPPPSQKKRARRQFSFAAC